jgi:CO dehydrogenase/acetyl-CoA synthase delta subunit
MPVEVPKQQYTGSIREINLGKAEQKLLVGGESAFPFYLFEGAMPHSPKIAIQVLDFAPDDWAEACTEPWRDVLGDPVAWARKAQNEYGADMIHLWLKSTDPNGLNRPADEAAQTAKAVAAAVSIPVIVWGCANADKDAEVLKKVAELCAGMNIIIGPVVEANHKQLGAQALAYNLTLVANTPIDINLSKQLNILLNNVGVPLEKIIIDPTTGGLGYGMEYSFSVMERIRQAALTQNDDKLQCPFLCNFADEVWKTKEAKLPTDPQMGDAKQRGILMEAITAVTVLLAGADILVMRHPEAIEQVRDYVADLGGFERPKAVKAAAAQVTTAAAAGAISAGIPASIIAESLREGALCKIVQIMDLPMNLAPGYAVALIKALDKEEAGEGLVLMPKGAAAVQESAAASSAAQAGREAKPEVKEEFKPSRTWVPLQDTVGEYKYKLEEKTDFAGRPVKLIKDNYDSGVPTEKEDWRSIEDDRAEMLKRVKTSLRYWYAESYGSERRKKPA